MRVDRLSILLLFLLLAAFSRVAHAAPSGSELSVYVVTIGPGDAVWEKFGHISLRVVDRTDPSVYGDIAFNWGLFNFNEADFFPRFLRGTMYYWMDGFRTDAMLEDYKANNRVIRQQELNLSAKQKAALREFLFWNAQPANKHYRYDYYRDNCSTRLRDAVDRVVGGAIKAQLEKRPTQSTYRSLTGILTADDVPVYTALMLVMGHPVDRTLNAWEESFLPEKLMEHLRVVQVKDENGTMVPLVKAETVLASSTRPAERATPPGWVVWYLLAGIAIGAAAWGLMKGAGRWPARWGFYLVFTPWFVVLGLLGLFVVWAALFSDHWAVARNENLLQCSPLMLVLAVAAVGAAGGRRWAIRPARWIAVAGLGLSGLGLLLKVAPGFDQVNGGMIALMLPMHAGVALGLWGVKVGTKKEAKPGQAATMRKKKR